MYKNAEMEQMLASLQKHLKRRDIIGYAAARNTRILRDELKEYIDRRDELVRKYGTTDVDEKGNPTGSITIGFDDPNFAKFAEEMEQYATIEHAPNIMRLKYEDAIGILSGAEILEVDWMFEED